MRRERGSQSIIWDEGSVPQFSRGDIKGAMKFIEKFGMELNGSDSLDIDGVGKIVGDYLTGGRKRQLNIVAAYRIARERNLENAALALHALATAQNRSDI